MGNKNLATLFAKAATKGKFLTPKEETADGIIKFKQKTLGIFKSNALKTPYQMANILQELGMASSKHEATKILLNLIGVRLEHGMYNTLKIDLIRNTRGQLKYKIKDEYSRD